MTPESRGLISKLEGSTFFKVSFSTFSENEANDLLHRNKCSMILQIPSGFGKDIGTGNPGKLTGNNRCHKCLNCTAFMGISEWSYPRLQYGSDHRKYQHSVQLAAMPQIQITNRYWYNEMLNYKYYMLPGILVILVTAIGFLLAGLKYGKGKRDWNN